MSELLEIKGLTAGYDTAPVIRGVSLGVGAGEVLAMLGANGAGKTTILRVISGIVRPMAGSVTVLGSDVARVSPHRIARRGVAHVAEGRSIFFGLTVAEHFKLGHRGERLDISKAFEYFPQLQELRDRRAGLLSGGEQQMLTLCRTLMGDPDLIIIDEPTEGLAPKIVELVGQYLQTLKAKGISVLLIEQKLTIAMAISDRALVMGHGSIVFDGTPDSLRADVDIRKEWLEV